jgi:UDP-N-acetylglucosamine 1-carboxyvinyltransferase
MQQFVIDGGHPVRGEITAGGNKNAALKMIPACLLTDEPVILHNVPAIGDVHVLAKILQSLGVSIDWLSPNVLRVHAQELHSTVVDRALAGKLRASIMLAGPMLARMGRLQLPAPGGDAIGERRLDMHVYALQKLGAHIDYADGAFSMSADGLLGVDILLSEASVTATENTVMAAVLAQGTTVLRNAASEPHVQNLCDMLNSLGADIEGIGSNRLIIHGVERLHGGEARVGADYMEVGSFIGVAAMTGGELTIKAADPQHLGMIEQVYERLGVTWETHGQDIFVPSHQSLTIVPDLGSRIPSVKAQPWPAFPPDLMSIALVIATQSAGAVLFHDWMYESRFFFTDRLIRMGARVTMCDPHRVLVQGPTSLKGSAYVSSPDIRAGMALILAALAAKGETRIANIQQIDRGYERVEEKLQALGANIVRIYVGELPAERMEG